MCCVCGPTSATLNCPQSRRTDESDVRLDCYIEFYNEAICMRRPAQFYTHQCISINICHCFSSSNGDREPHCVIDGAHVFVAHDQNKLHHSRTCKTYPQDPNRAIQSKQTSYNHLLCLLRVRLQQNTHVPTNERIKSERKNRTIHFHYIIMVRAARYKRLRPLT